jgi:enoyl-CoA hydratase/carnithine racemase
MSEHIVTEHHGRVLTIRMTRAEKKNALTIDMYRAMANAIAAAVADPGVRALRLSGTDSVFTSGNDLGDFAGSPPAGMDSPVFLFLHQLSQCPKPIVAAVNGLAIGIGTTMLLHCDLIVADPSARFSLPFINLGLVPEAASSLLLPRMLGHAKASELLLLGDMFDASAAERFGIVNRISAVGAADADALQWAELLAAKAPDAMRKSKALLKSQSQGVQERMMEEGSDFAAQLRSSEFAESLAAFREKRAPQFP